MAGKPVKVTSPCVASKYAGPHETIIEFHGTRLGGLISLEDRDDGTLRIQIYRADEGVLVFAGGQLIPAHTTLNPMGGANDLATTTD